MLVFKFRALRGLRYIMIFYERDWCAIMFLRLAGFLLGRPKKGSGVGEGCCYSFPCEFINNIIPLWSGTQKSFTLFLVLGFCWNSLHGEIFSFMANILFIVSPLWAAVISFYLHINKLNLYHIYSTNSANLKSKKQSISRSSVTSALFQFSFFFSWPVVLQHWPAH